MIWRKEYGTIEERKRDQRKGFLTCLFINVLMGLRQYTVSQNPPALAETQLLISAVPWVVNIGLILLTLIFRPQFAIGYLAFIATAIVGGIVVGIWFVVSCVASLVVMVPASMADNPTLETVGLYCGFGLVLPGVFFYGLYKLIRAYWSQIRSWWLGESENHPSRPTDEV